MSALSKHTVTTLIPCLAYDDAPAALEWLCQAFGFEQRMVVRGEDGSILHAQLAFGSGMLMLGSRRKDSLHGQRVKPPISNDGHSSQSIYVVVNSADGLYAQAKAAGAEIVIDLKDEDHGGRGFTCRDPEGHLWSFGTYDPWAEQQAMNGEPN